MNFEIVNNNVVIEDKGFFYYIGNDDIVKLLNDKQSVIIRESKEGANLVFAELETGTLYIGEDSDLEKNSVIIDIEEEQERKMKEASKEFIGEIRLLKYGVILDEFNSYYYASFDNFENYIDGKKAIAKEIKTTQTILDLTKLKKDIELDLAEWEKRGINV
jgi:hypothetical protein